MWRILKSFFRCLLTDDFAWSAKESANNNITSQWPVDYLQTTFKPWKISGISQIYDKLSHIWKCVQYHRGGAVVLHNCFLVKAVEFFAIFLHQNFHSMKSCCGGQIVEFHISNSPILCIEQRQRGIPQFFAKSSTKGKNVPKCSCGQYWPLLQSSQSPLLAEYLINLTSCQITQDFPAFAFSKGGKCVQV